MKNLITKLKKSLTNNWGIKITALIVASFIWLAVVNVNDPEKTVTINNIPIIMTHEETITELGMVYSLESRSNINITITGKRSVVGDLSAEDFVATASLAELSKVNVIPVEVSAINPSVARRITVVKQSLNTVKVAVENIETQEFNIEVDFSGDTADGYTTGGYSVQKDKVKVKAPESVLDKIERAVAVCDLESSSSDIEKKCDIVLYDKRGKVVKSENLEMSINKVTVFVNILQKKEVPVNVTTVGNPADGYHVSDITLSEKTVTLVGEEMSLADIESLDIDGDVNIAGQRRDVTTEIDLNNYLPDNVSISGQAVIQVTVKIEGLETKTYTIETKDISIENLDENLSAEISGKSAEITLRGEKAVLDGINADDITASVDLKGKNKGTSRVKLSIDIPEGTELMDDVMVRVKIK